MKTLNPKTASISVTTVAVAFVGGLIIASHPNQPARTQLYKATADTTASQTDASTPATGSSSQTQASTTANTSSSPSSVPQMAPSAAGNTSTALTTSAAPTTTTQAPAQPSAPTAPALTAVSAQLTDWSNPQPTDSKGGLANANGVYIPFPTTVQHRYCIWTYSDGSTQQAINRTKYTTTPSSGAQSTSEIFGTDCTIANAPSA